MLFPGVPQSLTYPLSIEPVVTVVLGTPDFFAEPQWAAKGKFEPRELVTIFYRVPVEGSGFTQDPIVRALESLRTQQ